MDGGQDAFDTLLQNLTFVREAIFSAKTLRLLNEHIFSPSSSLNILRRQTLDAMAPIVTPLVARLNQILINSPDIVVLLFVVLIFVLAVQVLAWIRRMLVWITGLIFRLVFWSAVAAAVAFVYQRGAEQTVRDLVVLVSKITGYGARLRDIWLAEYQRYDGQQQPVGGAGGAYGYYAGRGR